MYLNTYKLQIKVSLTKGITMKKEDRLDDHKETFLLMFTNRLRNALKTGSSDDFEALEQGLEAAKRLTLGE